MKEASKTFFCCLFMKSGNCIIVDFDTLESCAWELMAKKRNNILLFPQKCVFS